MARCPSCDQDVKQQWGNRDGLDIFWCEHCDFRFFDRDELPSVPNDYQDYYPYLDKFGQDDFRYELSIRYLRIQNELENIKQYANGNKVVDIGAGPGYLCRIASEIGIDAVGVEISETAKKYGRKHFDVNYVELSQVKDGSVDIVVLSHVIEHLAWPKTFLNEVSSKLKKDGLIVIKVPNFEPLSYYIKNRIVNGYGRRTYQACAMYYPDHLSGFTSRALISLLGGIGFDCIKLKNVGMWSSYYDPFFLKNVMAVSGSMGVVKKSLRGAVDTVGCLFDRGDWLFGVFKKSQSPN